MGIELGDDEKRDLCFTTIMLNDRVYHVTVLILAPVPLRFTGRCQVRHSARCQEYRWRGVELRVELESDVPLVTRHGYVAESNHESTQNHFFRLSHKLI